jgi:hypothetical protein
MRRTRMKRGTKRLKRGGRLRPVSPKRQAGRAAWAAVYRKVDRRSGGRCEVILDGIRCHHRADDHHHTRKPRTRWNDPRWVIAICRSHHERCDVAYPKGRLRIFHLPDGFLSMLIFASSKAAARMVGDPV